LLFLGREAGDPKKTLSFLPADKQFLIARNIPCRFRAKAVTGSQDSLQHKQSAKPASTDESDEFGFDILTKSGADSSAAPPASSSSTSAPVPPPPQGDDEDEPIDDDDDIPAVSEPKDAVSHTPLLSSALSIYSSLLPFPVGLCC
jgi:hypothetical protein